MRQQSSCLLTDEGLGNHAKRREMLVIACNTARYSEVPVEEALSDEEVGSEVVLVVLVDGDVLPPPFFSWAMAFLRDADG
jgi:hypothetical protein